MQGTPQPGAKILPMAQFTMARHDEDRYSDNEAAVGGLLDEDDSLEQELAMSSPLKGVELQAKKVCRLHTHIWF